MRFADATTAPSQGGAVDLIPRRAPEARAPLSTHWLGVAQDVADRLALDVLERDRANEHPTHEVALLREQGLLNLTIPADCGGAGESYRTAFNVIRIIARADPSVAQVLGYHLDICNRILEAGDEATHRRVMRDSAANAWLFATMGGSPQRRLIEVRDGPDGGYVVSDRRVFATGSAVADRIRAFGAHVDTGERLVMLLDAHSPQVQTGLPGWDFLGQRLSASSGIALTDYVVPPQDVIGRHPRPQETSRGGYFEYHAPLTVLSQDLVFSHLYIGIGEGALLAAGAFTRTQARPYHGAHPSVVAAVDDPFVQHGYGGLLARLTAAAALVDRAEAELQWAYDQDATLGPEDLRSVTALVSAAKSVSEEIALEVGTRLYDFTGGRSGGSSFGLDRFWRNVRALSLHDPIAYHVRTVGESFLAGLPAEEER